MRKDVVANVALNQSTLRSLPIQDEESDDGGMRGRYFQDWQREREEGEIVITRKRREERSHHRSHYCLSLYPMWKQQ